jgi:EmrB/QacA subfamily drug resistance transporter
MTGDGFAPGRGATAAALPGQISRRWLALVFISLAQLMIALDATVMNIALPSAQAALGFSDTDRQWVITAYTVAFGGLLLLGGRIADHAGRKRAFLVGLTGFAAVSALGGAANSLGMLITARAAQGAFGALLAPTVLSLLVVTFTEPRERARAFAVFGAIAGGGGAIGLVLGGLLTQDLSWRWCLYVNAGVAVVAAAGGGFLLPASRPARPARLDVLGALLATGGLVAVVYACGRTATRGWASPLVIGLLAGGAVQLALFTWRQARAPAPLLPLRIVAERNRAGAYLSVAFAVAGMLGLFLFLTYYLQVVLGYSPVTAGLAFLPLSAAVLVSSQTVAAKLLPHVAPRVLIVPGLLVAAVAMLLLTRLTTAGGYAGRVLPAEVLLGIGMGCVFVPAISTATQRVEPRDAGAASAVVNTAQQVGGSIGVALLNTVAASATLGYLRSHPYHHSEALVHGYATAAAWAAGIFGGAALLAAVLINAGAAVAPHPSPGRRSR